MSVDAPLPLTSPAWPDAHRHAHQAASSLPSEPVALSGAVGRVLASDLVAPMPVPGFSASAMDGWAVAGPGPWHLVGEVTAGHPRRHGLLAGTAVAVTTGAVVPHGTSAVVRQERGRFAAGVLTPTHPVTRDGDIRHSGEELRSGDLIAPAGTTVTPALVGLAAAAGLDDLCMRRRPQVGLLVLGDELLSSGPARDGRVRDALGVQVPGWVAALGGCVVAQRSVPDRLDATCDAITSCAAEVVITTGGSSVGRHDHVRAALAAIGGRREVDEVAVRPGHPMLLGALPDGRWLVGLPGNPGAAVAAVLTLLSPLLAGLLGRPEPDLVRIPSGADVGPGRGLRMVPAVDRAGHAMPARANGPAMLRGWATATHALLVPPEGARVGTAVEALTLPRW